MSDIYPATKPLYTDYYCRQCGAEFDHAPTTYSRCRKCRCTEVVTVWRCHRCHCAADTGAYYCSHCEAEEQARQQLYDKENNLYNKFKKPEPLSKIKFKDIVSKAKAHKLKKKIHKLTFGAIYTELSYTAEINNYIENYMQLLKACYINATCIEKCIVFDEDAEGNRYNYFTRIVVHIDDAALHFYIVY